jgi:N-acetylglucosaminyl-diphospho-decaprenol L-rhamnosyltransferase
MTAPRLTIVIVSYNSREDLDRCLASLASHRAAVAHEVVVIDNASTDGTPDLVRTKWPGIRLIDAGANIGFARANNIAIRQTTSELILLLNGDTIMRAGAIDTLVHTLDQHPDAAVAGPRIVDGGGRAELSFGRMIGPFAEARQKLLVRGNDAGIGPIARYVDRATRQGREVDWVSGACLLVRRADAEAVGLLDERYFMYGEDVDFCAAIRARGGRVLFTPAAEVIHLRGRSAATQPKATASAYRRAHLAFYEKHHPAWAPVLRMYLRLRGQLPDRSGTP